MLYRAYLDILLLLSKIYFRVFYSLLLPDYNRIHPHPLFLNLRYGSLLPIMNTINRPITPRKRQQFLLPTFLQRQIIINRIQRLRNLLLRLISQPLQISQTTIILNPTPITFIFFTLSRNSVESGVRVADPKG